MTNIRWKDKTDISSVNSGDRMPITKISDNNDYYTTPQEISNFVKTGLTKSDVGLGNVDNTSDLNKPISTATQTALDGKVDENVAIVGATKTKITYDSKGLVTAGADATTADIADSLNKRYVTDANLTVINNTSGTNTGDNATNSQYSGLATSKQDTLVSGTNIKTINGNSILGSGNLIVSGTGDVVGPSSSTDNAIARFDSITGKLIQNGIITESDNGDLQSINTIGLNNSPTSINNNNGVIYWNDIDKTVDIIVDNTNGVIQQVGHELYIRAVNKTGVTITDGQVVYISGAQGNRPTVAPARANTFSTSDIIGVATQNILNNAEGFITTFGVVHGYNTSGFTTGDTLYISPSTPGTITNVPPSSPNYLVVVGKALDSTNNGHILVKPAQPLDTDGTIADNSDLYAITAKATKTYVDTTTVPITRTVNGKQLNTNITLAVDSSDFTMSDNTTNDVSTSKHGFAPKAPNDTSKFLRGDGTWAAPAGGSSPFYETNIDGQIYTGTIAYFVATQTQTIAGVYASLQSLPTGSNVTIQVYKNGTSSTNSIFTSDTPLSITTTTGATNGVYSVLDTTIDNGALVAGDVIYIVITAVGSTLPGSDLYIRVY